MGKFKCVCWIDFNKLIYDFGFGYFYETIREAKNQEQAEEDARTEFFIHNNSIPYLVMKCKCKPEEKGGGS